MARSGKVGIDYFSHDVDMMQDTKIKIIKAKHGLIGYAVYLRLLEELYRENGYYLHLTQDFNILFSDDNNLELNVYILILNDCIDKKLFNKKVYDRYSILTSSRIQKNYCDAIFRRKEAKFIKEYLLVDVKNLIPQSVNVDILPLNDNINIQNADIGTQIEIESKPKGKTKPKPKQTYSPDFNKFWEAYPKRLARGAAWKAWQQKDLPPVEQIIAALKQQNMDGRDKFTPYPATWLNANRWEDEKPTEPKKPEYKPLVSKRPDEIF
jgi:hypothetical protein